MVSTKGWEGLGGGGAVQFLLTLDLDIFDQLHHEGEEGVVAEPDLQEQKQDASF